MHVCISQLGTYTVVCVCLYSGDLAPILIMPKCYDMNRFWSGPEIFALNNTFIGVHFI